MSVWIIPYIVMNGDAREAIRFYEEALDAELQFIQPAAGDDVADVRDEDAGRGGADEEPREGAVQGDATAAQAGHPQESHGQESHAQRNATNPRREGTDEKLPPVSHATLRIGTSTVMIRDAAPGETRRDGDQVTLAVATYDVDEARRIFAALAREGTVHAPLQETPFSPAHGLVTDKFGVVFQITAQPK